jgi:AcrR family transcriptional regulator
MVGHACRRNPIIFRERLMPAISPQRMRDRHDAILGAATRVFAEKGYSAASITEIAQAAE